MDNSIIYRQQAIDALMERFKRVPTNAIIAKDVIENLPSVQPEPKTGHWIILDSDSERCEDIKCPFCGHTFTVDAWRWCDIGFVKEDFNFCPNCGAHMKGGTT